MPFDILLKSALSMAVHVFDNFVDHDQLTQAIVDGCNEVLRSFLDGQPGTISPIRPLELIIERADLIFTNRLVRDESVKGIKWLIARVTTKQLADAAVAHGIMLGGLSTMASGPPGSSSGPPDGAHASTDDSP